VTHDPQTEDGRLEELVTDALQEMEQGRSPDLDALCVDCPELKSAVAGALALASGPAYRAHTKALGSLAGCVFDSRYVLSECIGSGAMGAVYRADDLDLGRTVALKFLRTEMLHGKENERRFEREGEVLAQLNHVSIATVHDRKRTDDGDAYIVMEYIDGISMQHALDDRAALGKEGHMPVREAVEHAAQLARALEVVHEAGIVHRDIKPSNIMLSNRGPVLIDFGIAAVGAQETLAEGTRGVGTPAYMAPEQLRGGSQVGPSVDIYGLTACLYRALTGNAPYEGTPAEVLTAIPLRDPELPATLRPDLPRDLLAILDVGLNRDLGKRYDSITQLRKDLEAFLDHEPVQARYPGAFARLGRRVRRSPAALATIAVTMAFVLSLLGYWGYGEYDRNRSARMTAAESDALAHMQPMLTLWNAADRAMPDGEPRKRERELLDRAAANALHPLPALSRRAAFLWDQGEHKAAIADIEAIAEQLPGAVTEFLAKAYRDAAATDADRPNIDGSPEPVTTDDVYLLAYHELRRRNFKAAKGLLFDSRLDEFEPALEQRLLFELEGLRRLSAEDLRKGARQLHEAVLRMEERYGRTTAMTAHLEGIALVWQQRYGEALNAIHGGLELAPHSANLLENAGIALRRLGDMDDAAEHLAKAIALRPHAKDAYKTLFWVHLIRARMGREEAQQKAVDLLESPMIPERARERLRGELDFELVLRHHLAAEHELARGAAEDALQKWRQTGHDDEFKVAVVTSLSEGRQPFTDVAKFALRDLSKWHRMVLALSLMPDQLGKEDSRWAKQLLYALVQEKAPKANLEDWVPPKISSKRQP
jgi:tRNA A-37 threonylcarbamoyl transferase component Bud32/Flp pilus assembly protein TadD